ncbi:MAG: hypothetical protein Q7S92_06545 [Candidatus Diapherotrites archaeon]|nr:hypothetical protein [Candidatus Diapherotrites archaeon]
MSNFFQWLILFLIAVIVISGCTLPANEDTELPAVNDLNTGLPAVDELKEQDCSSNTDCESNVCDFQKQDLGICAPVTCIPGSQANGLNNIAFFCNEQSVWQEIKPIGESCNFDYECFRKTDKDCPSCNSGDYIYSCKNAVCVQESQQNECEAQGLKRITSKEDADSSNDGSCFETLAQRPIFTVCAACGNNVCETELESNCNCPEDCE